MCRREHKCTRDCDEGKIISTWVIREGFLKELSFEMCHERYVGLL